MKNNGDAAETALSGRLFQIRGATAKQALTPKVECSAPKAKHGWTILADRPAAVAWRFPFLFLPRCMECRRGLAMRILSVRLSVKRVICDKMEERSVQIFTSYERSFSLVF